LELFEFNTRNDRENRTNSNSENNINTEFPKKEPQNFGDANIQKSDISKEKDMNPTAIIEDGILFCNSCSRFYPIVEEIPIILPDNLRDKNKDLEILKKWSHLLPEKIKKNALPWHL
jgi:uncharacterized protein YbaR (Trm112 family)